MTDRWVSLCLGLCCLLVYNLNGRAISSGDAFPARYQPFAILGYHTVLLDPVEAVASQGRTPPASWQAPHTGAAYWMIPTRAGHVISLYSPVLPVLVAPLYVPAAIYLHARGWTDERIDIVARVMEKIAASVVASLSVALLYVVLRRRTSRSNGVLLAVAYAFGTTTWVIGSQALWQHGMGQLLIVIAMLLLTGPCTAPRAFAAGVVCALIAGNRPPDAVLALPLGLYALFWAGPGAAPASRFEPRVLLVAAALLSAAPVLLYNLGAVGTISGAYALVGHAERFFANDPLAGLAGLLFSPTRGLFVFSPFLLFLALAWRYRAAAVVALQLHGLARWHFVGPAVHDRPAADPDLDARAGRRRAAASGPRRLRDRRRRRHRHRSGRRVRLHRRYRPSDLRGARRRRQAAPGLGVAQRSVHRVALARPRASGTADADARQHRRRRSRRTRD
jgi:hypothetical protein